MEPADPAPITITSYFKAASRNQVPPASSRGPGIFAVTGRRNDTGTQGAIPATDAMTTAGIPLLPWIESTLCEGHWGCLAGNGQATRFGPRSPMIWRQFANQPPASVDNGLCLDCDLSEPRSGRSTSFPRSGRGAGHSRGFVHSRSHGDDWTIVGSAAEVDKLYLNIYNFRCPRSGWSTSFPRSGTDAGHSRGLFMQSDCEQ